MVTKCAYCDGEIPGPYVKYDKVGKVYLHDGLSLTDFARKLEVQGSTIIETRIPATAKLAEEAKERMRRSTGDRKDCAQLYKAARIMKGSVVALQRIELSDKVSSA